MKHTTKVAVLATIALSTSACSGNYAMLKGPDFTMTGSAEGIDSFYQGIHGTVESSKTDTGAALITHSTYNHKEEHKSLRASYKRPAPAATSFGSFLSKPEAKTQKNNNGGS